MQLSSTTVRYFGKVKVLLTQNDNYVLEDTIKEKYSISQIKSLDDTDKKLNTLGARKTLFTSTLTIPAVISYLRSQSVNRYVILLEEEKYLIENDIIADTLELISIKDDIRPYICIPNLVKIECNVFIVTNIHLVLPIEGSRNYHCQTLLTTSALLFTTRLTDVIIKKCTLMDTRENELNSMSIFEFNKGADKINIEDSIFNNVSVKYEHCNSVLIMNNKFINSMTNFRMCQFTFDKNIFTDSQISLFNCNTCHIYNNQFSYKEKYDCINVDYSSTLFFIHNIIGDIDDTFLRIDRNSKAYIEHNNFMGGIKGKLLNITYSMTRLCSNNFSKVDLKISLYDSEIYSDNKNKCETEDVNFIVTDEDIVKPDRIVYVAI